MYGIILVSQVRQKVKSISIVFVLFMQREVQVESEEEAGLLYILYKRESPHRMRFQPLCETQSRRVKIVETVMCGGNGSLLKPGLLSR